ncbi:MAG: selenide, water dikinase SelD, partial [Verrucomicrobia bacterium]|nr:selenide, water dikinase SelD [Verrucomicrobiota bacterium]
MIQDLVLVGGGHSHLAVLKMFGMRCLPGVRLTLISKEISTPYSGMLPGHIAGHYSFDEAHIDLRPLCHFAGARLYSDRVTGLDLVNKRVLCADRPPVGFDLLSINIGSTPRAGDVPGAMEHALPVKPIDRFLQGWEAIVQRALGHGKNPFRIVVVGAGAGGVELALATQHRLQTALAAGRSPGLAPEIHLVGAAPMILPTHNPRTRRRFVRILQERGIHAHLGSPVTEIGPGLVRCGAGPGIACDAVLWVTDAAPPAWLAESGLRTDAEGFVAVNDCLQSVSHAFVFAAGDVAGVVAHPRPKSGVFAVRQGRPLAENLRLALRGEPPRPFAPQKRHLSLISTGDQYAVASRGGWAVEGRWVWRAKNWIDRRWMRQYKELPEMDSDSRAPLSAGLAATEAPEERSVTPAMRCGGCAAKVGGQALSRVLRRLKPATREDVLVGLDSPDDAAVTAPPPGQVCVQTIDFFRSFIDDPFVFGKVAANHCLGDIYAMGAEPRSALALALLPYGPDERIEEDLFQVMAGAMEVLAASDTLLVGGHTGEGAEMGFGLAVTGFGDPKRLLRKGGMKPSDRLILAKPLGTGTLFAADMRRRTRGRWIEGAILSMLVSNRAAARRLLQHGATACTDVTGFGLLGHLVEMAKASSVGVEISIEALPLLEGVAERLGLGILS